LPRTFRSLCPLFEEPPLRRSVPRVVGFEPVLGLKTPQRGARRRTPAGVVIALIESQFLQAAIDASGICFVERIEAGIHVCRICGEQSAARKTVEAIVTGKTIGGLEQAQCRPRQRSPCPMHRPFVESELSQTPLNARCLRFIRKVDRRGRRRVGFRSCLRRQGRWWRRWGDRAHFGRRRNWF
jgi:hypothetical protein